MTTPLSIKTYDLYPPKHPRDIWAQVADGPPPSNTAHPTAVPTRPRRQQPRTPAPNPELNATQKWWAAFMGDRASNDVERTFPSQLTCAQFGTSFMRVSSNERYLLHSRQRPRRHCKTRTLTFKNSKLERAKEKHCASGRMKAGTRVNNRRGD